MSRHILFRHIRTSLALVLMLSLTCPNATIATSVDVFALNTSSPTTENKEPTDIDSIIVPEDIGLIKDVYKGDGRKLIIHIQDAHCNFEAQNNIAKLLQIFMEDKGLVLVALEGSAGEIDTSLFTTFPDEEIRKEVATYFMKKGKISGAEYLAINSKKPIMLYGIENKEYYLQNLKAFTDSLPHRDATKQFCRGVKTYLNRLKRYIYNKELKELDSKIEDYDSDKVKFVDFCVYLNGLARDNNVPLASAPNFLHLMAALEAEKDIDFKKVDNERSAIISELEKRLSQDALSDLLLKSLSYKTKKISASEYYAYLKDVAIKARIKFDKFQNFDNYVNYLAAYAKIDNASLFRELTTVQEEIKESLYTNEDQRLLNRLCKNIRIMNDLLDISLSKDEAAYVTEHYDEFNSGAFNDFIERQALRYGLSYTPGSGAAAIDEVMPGLGKFYDIAEKREDALLHNTISKMDEKGYAVSALISGGYHTEGLTNRFKEQGISYVVIAPRITDLEAESPYLEILSGGKAGFEEAVTEEE